MLKSCFSLAYDCVWPVNTVFPAVDEVQTHRHFVVVIGSSHWQHTKSPLVTILIINLLGKGLTSRACMGDGGSI